MKVQFEIKGVKRELYVMVQKYINVKSKLINLGPKGLSKIELKKNLCKITNLAQIEPKPKPAKPTNPTRLTDDPNRRVCLIYRVGCGL